MLDGLPARLVWHWPTMRNAWIVEFGGLWYGVIGVRGGWEHRHILHVEPDWSPESECIARMVAWVVGVPGETRPDWRTEAEVGQVMLDLTREYQALGPGESKEYVAYRKNAHGRPTRRPLRR